MLKDLLVVSSHRGCKLSRLGEILASTLQAALEDGTGVDQQCCGSFCMEAHTLDDPHTLDDASWIHPSAPHNNAASSTATASEPLIFGCGDISGYSTLGAHSIESTIREPSAVTAPGVPSSGQTSTETASGNYAINCNHSWETVSCDRSKCALIWQAVHGDRFRCIINWCVGIIFWCTLASC